MDIDDDLLMAVPEIAGRERTSAGKVISRLLRQALTGSVTSSSRTTEAVGGFRPFASRGVPVTDTEIDRLRDIDGV